MIHSVPLVLKLTDWPADDRLAWTMLFETKLRFGRSTAHVTWSEGTKRLRAQCYGQWLSFLLRAYPDVLSLTPTERITRSNVEAFLAECEERLKPRSVHNHLLTLALLAKLWHAPGEWYWLWAAVEKARQAMEADGLRAPLPVSADQVYQTGLRGLELATTANDLFSLSGAVRFRQFLAMTILIACPVRVRALAAMTVSRHVVLQQRDVTLDFAEEDMKDRRARRYILPNELTDYVSLYVDALRPILKGERQTDAFWLSRNGRAMAPDDLTKELYRITGRTLNAPMHAHAFRHVVATTIADVAPEKANIIRDMLGHATIEMATKHYNRAEGSRRCSELQSLVSSLKAKASASQRIEEYDRRTALLTLNMED